MFHVKQPFTHSFLAFWLLLFGVWPPFSALLAMLWSLIRFRRRFRPCGNELFTGCSRFFCFFLCFLASLGGVFASFSPFCIFSEVLRERALLFALWPAWTGEIAALLGVGGAAPRWLSDVFDGVFLFFLTRSSLCWANFGVICVKTQLNGRKWQLRGVSCGRHASKIVRTVGANGEAGIFDIWRGVESALGMGRVGGYASLRLFGRRDGTFGADCGRGAGDSGTRAEARSAELGLFEELRGGSSLLPACCAALDLIGVREWRGASAARWWRRRGAAWQSKAVVPLDGVWPGLLLSFLAVGA